MKQLLTIAYIGAFTSLLLGCGNGDKLLRARGQVVKNGEDFIPDDEENLQVCFVPISEDGKPPRNWYAAEVDASTGWFYAAGAEKKGMPPGKYRVMVELKKNRKDLLGGKFDAFNSPFVFEIDDESTPMIVDLDNPPKK